MTKIYTIPQHELPKPKPTWGHFYKCQKEKSLKEAEINKKLRLIQKEVVKNKGKLWYLYLLELEDGMYYLGTTGNVARRFEAHRRGNGAKWTMLHRPVKVIEQRCLGRMSAKNACIIEQAVFDEYFLKYGYALRGAGKSRVESNW